jgi:hypothetical protein
MPVKRFIIPMICWAGLAVLSSVPYITLAVKTPRGSSYEAPMITGLADAGAYYADMAEARAGHILVRNQFTSEPQQPRLWQPLWMMLGWACALTHWSIPIVFHLARVLAIGAMVGFLWWLLERLKLTRAEKTFGLVAICTSSGLGWVGWVAGWWSGMFGGSYDLWVSESNTFLTLTHSALFILTEILLAWLIIKIGTNWLNEKYQAWRWAGPLMLLLAIVHPYDLVTLGAVLFIISVWRFVRWQKWPGREILAWVAWVAWVAPAIIYYLWAIKEPALIGWYRQNIDLAGPPKDFIVGFGLLWIPAIYGAWQSFRRKITAGQIMAGWAIISSLLIFAPGLTFPRRLSSGLHIAVAGLAALGLVYWGRRIKINAARFVAGITVIMFLALTNVAIVISYPRLDRNNYIGQYPPYITNDLKTITGVVIAQVPFDQPILAQPWTANIVTGLTGRTVVAGHGHQTINPQQKFDYWTEFRAANTSAARRREIIELTRTKWLIWTVADNGSDAYQPSSDQQWDPIIVRPQAALYRLKLN